MAPPILILQDVHLSFGGTPLLEGAEFSLSAGERLCLVGRNGSGKSTLLKIAAGSVEADHGERFVQPGATIRYLPQEPDLAGNATALAYVEAGLAPGDDRHRARYLLEQLGLSGEEHPAQLSGGEARRCALARVLAPEPDILLLDEPTNHLDLSAIEWLEGELGSSRSALVLISHDRRLLENLSQGTVWLDRGTTRRLDHGFSHFEAWRDEIVEQEERDRHKLDRRIAVENDWLRYGVTARRKRNQGRLRVLLEMRQRRRQQRRALGTVKLAVAEADLSGRLVVEASGVSKSFGGRPIVKSFSTRIQRGDRIGIVGPNGAGKTTLLRLLTGSLAADEGEIRLGTGLDMASLDQHRQSLDPDRTLAETLTDGRGDSVIVDGNAKHVVSYMKDFLFAPEQTNSPVSALSGGERGRLLFACALARPSNLLVLDEPTNDLDLETLDLLEEMLADYPGTILLVSHDRDFLDRTVAAVIAAAGGGRWIEYAGGYSDMLAQRAAASADAAAPRSSKPRSASPVATADAAPKVKRRLSFKEKHALETLPERIEALEAEIARLRTLLADPGFYARDAKAFAEAATVLRSSETTLSAAEDQWLRLELLRETLG